MGSWTAQQQRQAMAALAVTPTADSAILERFSLCASYVCIRRAGDGGLPPERAAGQMGGWSTYGYGMKRAVVVTVTAAVTSIMC